MSPTPSGNRGDGLRFEVNEANSINAASREPFSIAAECQAGRTFAAFVHRDSLKEQGWFEMDESRGFFVSPQKSGALRRAVHTVSRAVQDHSAIQSISPVQLSIPTSTGQPPARWIEREIRWLASMKANDDARRF